MSARKLEDTGFSRPTAHRIPLCLSLAANAVRIRKNGIEFHTRTPLACWTEVDLSLQSPGFLKRVKGTGVIVACEADGGGRSGYRVSMLFTHISRQSQAALNLLVPPY